MRTLLLMIFAALSLSVSAQTITLNGNVKDTTGEPIIGASIVEKGNTTNGTITNLDGNFSLKVPANATVVISYIGMKTQEIAIKGKSKIEPRNFGRRGARAYVNGLAPGAEAGRSGEAQATVYQKHRTLQKPQGDV